MMGEYAGQMGLEKVKKLIAALLDQSLGNNSTGAFQMASSGQTDTEQMLMDGAIDE